MNPSEQSGEGYLQGHALDAAQAATRDLGDRQAIVIPRHERRVESDLAEFVDQDRPALVGGALGEQLADQGGLAGAQRASDHMGLDIGEAHGGRVEC